MRVFSLILCICVAALASSLAVDQAEKDFASAVQLHSAGKLDAAIKKMVLSCKQGGSIAVQACFNAGVYLSESQNFAESSKYFRLSTELDGGFALAYSNLGVTHQYLGDFAAALSCYESALKISPKDATTYFNIGKVNQELGRTMEAIRSFEHSVRLKPDYFEAYATLGGAFTPLRDWERSSSLLRDALKLQPDSVEGLYLLLYAEMQMCSWSQTTQLMRMIRPLIAQRLIRDERPGMEAYASLTMPWTLLEQTLISASFSRAAARNVQHLPPLPKHDSALSKLRVVFKSYDFADHMSLYLIIEAMEMLAERRDTVSFAFSVRSDDGSDLVRRLRVAFAERYVCVAHFDSYTAAAKINERKPHVMVDLDGHFRNSRLEISALQPAPHQMRYPMYVGSAGATYLPVMFADRVVLPPELALDVSEKVVFMPETFYFNSHPTSFPSSGTALCPPSERSKWNLPSSGVVLLNHNQFYKFDKFSFYTMCTSAAASFDAGAGRGTIWLKSETASVHNRLSSVCKQFLGSSKRFKIVHAEWTSGAEEHVSRLCAADLSVDSLVYNGMTTACDSLWANVPLVSAPGHTMVSRLASSLLLAAGLPHFVARSRMDFLSLSTALVYDHALRHGSDSGDTVKLSKNRRSSVLERARGHLMVTKKHGQNVLFCNKLKLHYMMAGMRMSWEARSMHVIVAKVRSKDCALGEEHLSS